MSKKSEWYKLLKKQERERWAKINDKFAKNDSPAGCKLMATGCMERFNHTRNEELSGKKDNVGINGAERREREVLNNSSGMSLNELTVELDTM